jgi:hypothetical protein
LVKRFFVIDSKPITWDYLGSFLDPFEIRFLVAAKSRLRTSNTCWAHHINKSVRNTVYKMDALVRSLWRLVIHLSIRFRRFFELFCVHINGKIGND